MRTFFSLGALVLCASAFSGIASAVLVSTSLERYAAALLHDRRFAALAPLQHASSPTTLEESLSAVQEVVKNSLVYFVDNNEEGSSFVSESTYVQGVGVVVSADGWVLTLGGYADEDMQVMRHGEHFVVDKNVHDTQTDAEALYVQGVQGWKPLELAQSDEVLPGGFVFGAGPFGEVFTTSLVRRDIEDEDSVPAEEPRAVWVLADVLPPGTPLFTQQARFFGFVGEYGTVVPAQAMRPLVKHALRGSALTHAGLGVFITDIAQNSSLSLQEKQAYTEGAFVLAPKGTRSATLERSAADIAGITEGDILLAIDGVHITRTVTIADILATYAPGQEITVRVARSGEVRDMQVTLDTWEELVY